MRNRNFQLFLVSRQTAYVGNRLFEEIFGSIFIFIVFSEIFNSYFHRKKQIYDKFFADELSLLTLESIVVGKVEMSQLFVIEFLSPMIMSRKISKSDTTMLYSDLPTLSEVFG